MIKIETLLDQLVHEAYLESVSQNKEMHLEDVYLLSTYKDLGWYKKLLVRFHITILSWLSHSW